MKGLSPAIWREAQRRGVPIVHTAHDFHLLCRRGTMLDGQGAVCRRRCPSCRIYGTWYRRQARAISVLCSPSSHVAQRHSALGLAPSQGMAVVHNGVGGTPLARPPRTPGRPLRLLFVGQLCREKGVQVLLAALAQMAPDVIVEVAGRGELEPLVRAAAARDPRLRFAGFVRGEAKRHLFDAADALVFPSVWPEPAGLVIAEAFMQGAPVVASDIGGISEFVRDGGNGLLVAPGGPAALAAAVQRLRDQPGLLEALSRGASHDAARYTVAGMVGRYRELYRAARPCGGVR